jgi:prepilin peptidase CpaA
VWLQLLKDPLMLGLFWMLVLAVMTDLSTRKIPNSIVIFGLIASLICQSMAIEGAGGINWLAGVTMAFACFIPLYVLRGMAAGDVKLMMAVGGFLGYPLIIKAVVCVFLSGGVMAIGFVILKGRFKHLSQNVRLMLTGLYIKTTSGVNVVDDYVMKNSAGRMPYALAIAVGTGIAVYLETTGYRFLE